MSSAFRCTLTEFALTTPAEKLGRLAAAAATYGFATHYTQQTDAWQEQLRLLAALAQDCTRRFPASGEWSLILEFEIPRRGRRPDAILIANDLIFVFEFKIGASEFSTDDRWQALSYAFDLRDFHLGSFQRHVIPLLVVTGDNGSEPIQREIKDGEPALRVRCLADSSGLVTAERILELYDRFHVAEAEPIDAAKWEAAPYRPTPTIIEAAKQLFAGHGVADISHSFAHNLDATCRSLLTAISKAKEEGRRVICLVTGIPGAGKTLAGLNTVHDRTLQSEGKPAAVFLSGNGPLVKIVRAALAKDCAGEGKSAQDVKRTVATFIGSTQQFLKAYAFQQSKLPPHENVVIFDEAQRAWDAAKVKRKHDVLKSQPELMLEVMERAPGWCAIIALVGAGQEIHEGEAGLSEWGRALNQRETSWDVVASPEVLMEGACDVPQKLFSEEPDAKIRITRADDLHLNVSVRSPRARRISEWVNGVLNGNQDETNVLDSGDSEFPIVMTRSLETARDWLRTRSEGKLSAGLVASSGALRLRAEGLEVSSGFRRGYPYDQWFLAGSQDSRSSFSLEVAATEFECQGLELEWTGICWGGDMVRSPRGKWVHRRFRGSRWVLVKKESEVQFLTNKYRVLLTRARRGMVIWVPRGNPTDPTREVELFDATAAWLLACGVERID